MPDTLLIQEIQSIGMIVAAFITAIGVIVVAILANRTRQHARVTRTDAAATRVDAAVALNELKNSHTIPLRDDLDKKFEGLAGLVKSLAVDVGDLRMDVGDVKTDVRDVRRDATEDRASANARIMLLEKTLTPAQVTRLRARKGRS